MLETLIFISYSREQFYFAESLSIRLKRGGLNAWFDVDQLAPGEDWQAEISSGLAQCSALLLVASRAALASPYVRHEWETALAAEKPVWVIYFEPVDLPPDLASVPRIDMSVDYHSPMQHLFKGVIGADMPSDPPPRRDWFGFPARLPREVKQMTRALALDGAFLGLYGGLFFLAGASLHALVLLATGILLVWLRFRFVRRKVGYRPLYAVLGLLLLLPVLVFGLLLLPAPIAPDSILTLVFLGAILTTALVLFPLRALRGLNSPVVMWWMPTGAVGLKRRSELNRAVLAPVDRSRRTAPAPYTPPVNARRTVRYHVFFQPADQSIAVDVRRAMTMAGHTEVDPPDADQHILIITRQSDPVYAAWLAENLPTLTPIIAENVDFDAYQSIARYQIVDYRSRNRDILNALGAYYRQPGNGGQNFARFVTPLSLSRTIQPSMMTRLENFQQDTPLARRVLPQSPDSALMMALLILLVITLPGVLANPAPSRRSAVQPPPPTQSVAEIIDSFEASAMNLQQTLHGTTSGAIGGLQYELVGWRRVEDLDAVLTQMASDFDEALAVEWGAIYADSMTNSETRLLALRGADEADRMAYLSQPCDSDLETIEHDNPALSLHRCERSVTQISDTQFGRGWVYSVTGGTEPVVFSVLVSGGALLASEPPAPVDLFLDSLTPVAQEE